MAQNVDHVGLSGSGVNGLLHGGVQSHTVGTAGNAVDVIAVAILEVGGSGLGEGLGSGGAHEGDLQTAVFNYQLGSQNGIAGDAVLLVGDENIGVGAFARADKRIAVGAFYVGIFICIVHVITSFLLTNYITNKPNCQYPR